MSDIETADRLARRRARVLPVLAILFIAQQATYFSRPGEELRPVDRLHVSAWLVLSIILLLGLATGGSWLRPARVRQLLDDESTRANRTEAMRIGFLATMAGAVMLYVLRLSPEAAWTGVVLSFLSFSMVFYGRFRGGKWRTIRMVRTQAELLATDHDHDFHEHRDL